MGGKFESTERSFEGPWRGQGVTGVILMEEMPLPERCLKENLCPAPQWNGKGVSGQGNSRTKGTGWSMGYSANCSRGTFLRSIEMCRKIVAAELTKEVGTISLSCR